MTREKKVFPHIRTIRKYKENMTTSVCAASGFMLVLEVPRNHDRPLRLLNVVARDPEQLTWKDQVRIRQNVLVGLEDRLKVRVAVLLLRDLGQRVAGLHRIRLPASVSRQDSWTEEHRYHNGWTVLIACIVGKRQEKPIQLKGIVVGDID